MTEASIVYSETIDRLKGYSPDFSDEIIEHAASVAAEQSGLTFPEFFEQNSISAPEKQHIEGAKPISVLHIESAGSDEHLARVRFLGIGARLLVDSNQTYQVGTGHVVAEKAGDGAQTFAFGNPGGIGHGEGRLSLRDMAKVARGNTRPLVDAPLRYLAGKGITRLDVDGDSFGSLIATTATEYAELYGMEVATTTIVEPADVKDRGRKLIALATLGIDFTKTAGPLSDYVEANDLDAFVEARADSITKMINYSLGVFSPNNIARSSAMANDLHEWRARKALLAQPNSRMHEVWGSNSELAIDGLMQTLTGNLLTAFPGRYNRTRVEDGFHNMVNDVALQAVLLHHARNN